MPKISYISHDGVTRTIEVKEGLSVMEGAIRNSLPGIEAECGGGLACATCHVLVDQEWTAKVGPPSEMEHNMLQLASEVGPRSRLSCQIRVTKELDGLVVNTPESQRSAL
jgi:2Fe-2S ferredoxin